MKEFELDNLQKQYDLSDDDMEYLNDCLIDKDNFIGAVIEILYEEYLVLTDMYSCEIAEMDEFIKYQIIDRLSNMYPSFYDSRFWMTGLDILRDYDNKYMSYGDNFFVFDDLYDNILIDESLSSIISEEFHTLTDTIILSNEIRKKIIEGVKKFIKQ